MEIENEIVDELKPDDITLKPDDMDVVDKDKQRAIDDLMKVKALLRESNAKIAENESSAKKAEESRLRQNEEWRKLAELKGEEAEEAIKRADGLKEGLVRDKKYSSLKEAALQSGIRKEALDDLELLDLTDISVEYTSTGRMNALGVKEYVDRLKTIRPHWFGRRGTNINSGTPETVMTGQVTYKQLLEAESKAKDTGDYAPYQKLVLEFKKQQ